MHAGISAAPAKSVCTATRAPPAKRVASPSGLSVLELESAELGPPLPTNITRVTAAAFAPNGSAVALTDGHHVSVVSLSPTEEVSWSAAGVNALAWRQDSNVLFGSSMASRPEQAWDPVTGHPVELLSPELLTRVETAELDPTWRWAIIPREPGQIVEIIRLVDGLTLYAGPDGAVTEWGVYDRSSTEWFLGLWSLGIGHSPLARGWRTAKVAQLPTHGRDDLVQAFFAGHPITAPQLVDPSQSLR